MVSLKQLNYALTVEKTRHFKQAADLCAVSQSALSTAIAELESQLDIQIFERDNKKVLVTPIGRQILEKAREIKLGVDDLHQIAAAQKSPLSQPMTLGVIPSIGPYLLPRVLPEVRKAYPDFPLTIVEEQSHILVERVRNGILDTAILALPYPLEGLHTFEFWQENFCMICHHSDAQADNTELSSDQLDTSRLLLLQDGHCLKDHALAVCKLKRKERDNSLAATSLHTLVQMVAGKMGITLIPEMAQKQLLKGNAELKSIPLNEPGPHRRVAFITRLNYVGVNNLEILMNMFKTQLAADNN